MTEDEVQMAIDSLVEDFSLEELKDEAVMLLHMRDIMGLRRAAAEVLLHAAREVKIIRGDNPALWQSILKQRYLRH